jgi:hypothetical protein
MIKARGIRILVLSSIHPMQIAELIGFFSRYENINAYSVQSFALLGEETLNKKYIPYNYTLATALKNKPEIILPTLMEKNLVLEMWLLLNILKVRCLGAENIV